MHQATAANVEAVRRLFEAVEERDIEPMIELYAPDAVIREADSLPDGLIVEATMHHLDTASLVEFLRQ